MLDTSVVVDFLLADGVAADVEKLLTREGSAAAPDLLVFAVVAVLRRDVRRRCSSRSALGPRLTTSEICPSSSFPASRSGGAPDLREDLTENLTAADALFVALAGELGERLATKDRGFAAAARAYAVETLELGVNG